MKNAISRTGLLLTLLCLPALFACDKEPYLDYNKVRNTQISTIYPKAENSIRFVSYNVGGFSKYTPRCYTLIACLMKELNADIIAMQEVDSCTSRNAHVDQLKCVADLLGMPCAFAPAMAVKDGYYGTGLICRDPIRHNYHVALPAGGEPRTVAVAILDDCIVASTHLDWEGEAQLQEVEVINQHFTERYGACGKPVFLLGDMNARPGSPILQALQEHWEILSVEGNTYSSHEPSMCIDYVLQLKNGAKCQVTDTQIPTRFVSGSVTQASDHLPIYVDVILQPGQ